MDRGPKCCQAASKWLVWKKPDTFKGPAVEGWSIIIHILVGTPEHMNITFCPFCGANLNCK